MEAPAKPQPARRTIALDNVEVVWRSEKEEDHVEPPAAAQPSAVLYVMDKNAAVPVMTATHVAIYTVMTASADPNCVTVTRAASWLVTGLLILFAEVSVLFSLGISNEWRTCNDPANFPDGSCPLGTICAQVLGTSSVYRRPYCLDCFFMSDHYGGNHAWSHVLVAQRGVNGTAHCVDQMLASENVRFWATGGTRGNDFQGYKLVGEPPAGALSRRSFSTCLFARAARENQSFLDVLIMYFAFVLLAVDTAWDAREQSRADFVRARALPVRLPSTPSAAGALHMWACALVKILAVGFSVAVPALIPTALLMMLMGLGSGSTDVILNGLAVGFVLELDNRIPAAFISVKDQETMREAFARLLGQWAQDEADKRQSDGERWTAGLADAVGGGLARSAQAVESGLARISRSATRQSLHVASSSTTAQPAAAEAEASAQAAVAASESGEKSVRGADRRRSAAEATLRARHHVRTKSLRLLARIARPRQEARSTDHPSDATVRFLVAMSSFIYGFYRPTYPDANIHCEMLLYFFYHRVAITYGVWMAFGLRELLEGAASIMYWSAIWAARRTAIKLTCELSNTDDDGRRTSDGFGDTPLLADGFARRLLLWWMGLLFRFTDTLCCVFVMHINFWMWCVIYWDNEPNVAFKYFWPFLDDPFGACAGSGYRHSWAGLECIE